MSSKVKHIHCERDKLQGEINHTAKSFKEEKEKLEKEITQLKPEEKQVSRMQAL